MYKNATRAFELGNRIRQTWSAVSILPMGVSDSKVLLVDGDGDILVRISTEWNSMKVNDFVEEYTKGGFDFTADSAFMEKFFEIDRVDADNIISRFSTSNGSKKKVVNIVIFLISVLCIFSNPTMTFDGRLKEILKLTDFKHQRRFTKNEFVVFLLCCGQAIGSTIAEQFTRPEIEMQIFASAVFSECRSKSQITFDNISTYAHKHFSNAQNTSCETVFQTLNALITKSNTVE